MSKKVTLYKYVSINHLKDIIETGRLKTSDGTDFNDPFELKVIRGDQQIHVNGLEILCLTNSFRKKLMWSHYSEDHKGVCLTIQLPADYVYAVCYSSERIVENGNNSNVDEILASSHDRVKSNLSLPPADMPRDKKVAFIKDSKWKDEKEYRAVFYSGDEVLENEDGKKFLKVTITNIYLGCRFFENDGEFTSEIERLCEEKGIKTTILKMSNRNYSLEVQRNDC
ncbi:MAG: DUF2971 domain-containing protein [Lachnospiraceae bacterium]|nr:DUF2971 domain-containing protein [Lachnospiraceae bacterium]